MGMLKHSKALRKNLGIMNMISLLGLSTSSFARLYSLDTGVQLFPGWMAWIFELRIVPNKNDRSHCLGDPP